jgi:hypothetical protein
MCLLLIAHCCFNCSLYTQLLLHSVITQQQQAAESFEQVGASLLQLAADTRSKVAGLCEHCSSGGGVSGHTPAQHWLKAAEVCVQLSLLYLFIYVLQLQCMCLTSCSAVCSICVFVVYARGEESAVCCKHRLLKHANEH